MSGGARRSRRLRAGAGAAAVAVAVLAGTAGCVGGPKTATTSILEPIPAGISIASDTTGPCKEVDAGFDYRYLVMAPADLTADSVLLAHFRDRGFFRTPMSVEDLPWVRAAYHHDALPVRLEAGPLDRYLGDARPYQGPNPDVLPQAVRDHPTQYLLVALRPTDFSCNTLP